jgi:predicted RNA binding protein YcfA (HicA-like mRNA interferase family)
MPRKYPPLSRREIVEILSARGFALIRTKGSHLQYEGIIKGKRRLVTVDESIDTFSDDLLKTIIAQSKLTREEFYRSTKATAKKINKKVDPNLVKKEAETDGA